MPGPYKVLVSWSSGKDGAWMLHVLRQDPRYEPAALLTTVSEDSGRVAMHGVRRPLLDAQASATGLPLQVVALPQPCPNAIYEARMAPVWERAVLDGIDFVAFGDLHLADVRAYREAQLARTGLAPLFPLWHEPTAALARRMIDAGLRAVITCVDTEQLDATFLGRQLDAGLLADLPDTIDPCAEHGEFHTFVHGGPMLVQPVPYRTVAAEDGGRFAVLDLAPAD